MYRSYINNRSTVSPPLQTNMRASVGGLPSARMTTSQSFGQRNENLDQASHLRDHSQSNGLTSSRTSVKLHGRRKKKNKQLTWILIGMFAVLVAAIIVKLTVLKDPVIYCDTFSQTYPPGCTLCPMFGRCSNGKLDRCQEPYVKYRNQCVVNKTEVAKFSEYRKVVNEELILLKGRKMCETYIEDSLNLHEIAGLLKQRFPHDDEYLNEASPRSYSSHDGYVVDSTPPTFEKRWTLYFEDSEGLVQLSSYPLSYQTRDLGNPPFSCKMKLIWIYGRYAIFWLVFVALLIFLGVRVAKRHLLYARVAEEMYQEVLGYLYAWHVMTATALKREFDYRHPDKDFGKLWEYVESISAKDGRIQRYVDYQGGSVQEFWKLVK